MKKQNRVTRLLSLLLVLSMLFTACAKPNGDDKTTKAENPTSSGTNATEAPTDAPEPEYPEYLNLDSAYPIIKDENKGTIKLKVALGVNDEAKEWEEMWLSKYFKDKYNIEFEVELYRTSTIADKKQILLNSGELPDMMINMNFSTQELVKYGVEEGIFLEMDQYINETLTPNIVYYFQDENLRRVCTTPDGNIYTLPKVADTARSEAKALNYLARFFINEKWLSDVNLEVPKTLDEFVNAMYAIKAANPVSQEKFYPFGGNMKERNGAYFILNALGYNVYNLDCYGLDPCLRDGEVVIPAYDTDVFKEYLRIMNAFYKDGIVDPDLFTMANNEVDADMAAGLSATYARAIDASGIPTWNEWVALTPLTSQWQTEPEYYEPTTTSTVGGFVISADTEYPELCMRFADMLFNNTTDVSRAILNGLALEPYNYEGYSLGIFDPEKNSVVNTPALPEGLSSTGNIYQNIAGSQWSVGAYGRTEALDAMAKAFGYERQPAVLDLTTAGGHYRQSMYDKQFPYLTVGYPRVYYASAEVSADIIRLETVIEPYAQEQIAKFISGERDLSEVDAFKNELKNLGMEDLLNIYKDIYTGYMQ